MEKIFHIIAIGLAMLCMQSPAAMALPLLSEDGSTMTGIEVLGIEFDVHFGDGVIGETYDPSAVLSSGWGARSQAISEAVASAIGALNLWNSGTYLKGCTDPYICLAFMPDLLEGDEYLDLDFPTTYFPELVPPVDFVETLRLRSSSDTADSADITLITFTPSASRVSVPGVVGMVALGLFLLAFFRQRNAP